MIYPSVNMLNGTPEKDYITEAKEKKTGQQSRHIAATK